MKKLLLTTMIFALSFSDGLAANGEKEVVDLIKNSAEAITVVIRNEALDKDAKIEKIMDIVNPVFDLPLMAKLTLGREYWPKLNKEQRIVFTNLFIKQLQVTYFDQMNLHSDGEIEYETPVKKGNKFYLTIFVTSKEEKVKLAYKIYKSKSGWRVYDIEFEDVSLVKSYSMQYAQILQKETVETLLKKMEDNIKELNQNDEQPPSPKQEKSETTELKSASPGNNKE